MVIFSDDENSLTLWGSRFSAVPKEDRGCSGCAMVKGFGCLLAEEVYKAYPALVSSSKFVACCAGAQRKDGIDVIWVPSHTVKVVAS